MWLEMNTTGILCRWYVFITILNYEGISFLRKLTSWYDSLYIILYPRSSFIEFFMSGVFLVNFVLPIFIILNLFFLLLYFNYYLWIRSLWDSSNLFCNLLTNYIFFSRTNKTWCAINKNTKKCRKVYIQSEKQLFLFPFFLYLKMFLGFHIP